MKKCLTSISEREREREREGGKTRGPATVTARGVGVDWTTGGRGKRSFRVLERERERGSPLDILYRRDAQTQKPWG